MELWTAIGCKTARRTIAVDESSQVKLRKHRIRRPVRSKADSKLGR